MTRDQLEKFVGKEVTITFGCKEYIGTIKSLNSHSIIFLSNYLELSGCYDHEATGTPYIYGYSAYYESVNDIKLVKTSMPKLKPGMIVEIAYEYVPTHKYLLVGADWGVQLGSGMVYTTNIGEFGDVQKVYKVKKAIGYDCLKANLEVIWEKTPEKTDKELKIEELEQTVKTALSQIEELKGE